MWIKLKRTAILKSNKVRNEMLLKVLVFFFNLLCVLTALTVLFTHFNVRMSEIR